MHILIPRRLFALAFLVSSVASLSAQNAPVAPPATEPAAATPPEKLTLDDAIRRALAKNYSLKVDSFNVSIAAANVTQQLGIFDPAITGSYNYSDTENPQLADPLTGVRPPAITQTNSTYSLSLGGLLPFGLTYSLSANSANARDSVAVPFDNYTSFAGVSARQPLLRGFGVGATTAQIRLALTDHHISEWQFKQSVIDTITRVIFAYYDLGFAQAQLRAALDSREHTARLVEENIKRNKVGTMSEFDVIQARSRLASREDGILQARQFRRDRENALKALITDDRTAALLDWRIEIELPALPPVTVVDAATDFREALKKRPDYQQAALAVKRGDINYRFQRNQLLPRVDLVGSYGYNGYDTSLGVSRRMVRNEDYRAYSYGVQVTVPLSFTTERGRYRAARFQLRQAEASLQHLEQDIVVQIGNAASQIETARQRVEATRAAQALGEQTLNAEVKRLRAGTSNTFFVLQQQEILTGLQISAAAALADYEKALAEYDRLLGVTLEKLNISVSVPK
jgi:outer membrane protein